MPDAMRGAAASAGRVDGAVAPGAVVPREGPEEGEGRVAPDGIEGVRKDISEPQLLPVEEQVAGIDRPVGQDAELRRPRGTAARSELGIPLQVGQEPRAEDPAHP